MKAIAGSFSLAFLAACHASDGGFEPRYPGEQIIATKIPGGDFLKAPVRMNQCLAWQIRNSKIPGNPSLRGVAIYSRSTNVASVPVKSVRLMYDIQDAVTRDHLSDAQYVISNIVPPKSFVSVSADYGGNGSAWIGLEHFMRVKQHENLKVICIVKSVTFVDGSTWVNEATFSD